MANRMCGSITAWRKDSHGAHSYRKFVILLFKTAHSSVLYISEWWQGPSKCHRARCNLAPCPPLSAGLSVTDVLAVWTAKPPLRLSGVDHH